MSDELAQLDELIESDILEALGQEVPKKLTSTEEVTTMEVVEPDELTNVPDGLLDPVEVTKEVEVEDNPQVDEEVQTDDIDDLLNSLEDEQSSSEDNLADLLNDEPLLEETAQETQEELLKEEISEPALEESINDEASEGEVLDDIGDIEILPMAEIESALEEEEEKPIQMNSSEAGSLAATLGQLLNNKTIEITIKIKD